MSNQESWKAHAESSENNRPGIPPLQHRQGAPPVLPPPSSLPSHSSMESGGYYSLPSINGLGGVNFMNNPPRMNTMPMNSFPVKSEGGQLPPSSNQQGSPQATQQGSKQATPQQPSAPTAQNTPGLPPPPPPGSNLAYRPLNVKDALSYLDQVKIQFVNRPDVYNHFLDIMKDFKSQAIDTPGVIDRVSTLFRGHPTLIQGFNTFLPPGYRIECSLDPTDPHPIRVTTPMGTVTRQESTSSAPFNEQRLSGYQNMQQGQQSQQQPQQPHGPQQQSQQVHQGPHDPYAQYGNQEQSSMSHLQAAASNRGSVGGERKSGGPVEFNHAIGYVNKIKTRFANQPDIYKHFLEILQTYQRDQKPISEVYQQVTILFQNAPDLLDDFKQFLPDTNGNVNGGLLQAPGSEYYQQPAPGQGQLPPVGNFSPPTAGKVKGFGGPNDQIMTYDAAKMTSKDIPTSNLRGSVTGTRKRVTDDITSPTLVPGVPEPVEPPTKTSNLMEEIGFFDKVKKAIGSKQSYNEFLKILNLFNQDLIDKEALIERVEGFIGSHVDLFDWFKSFVGFDDQPLHIENIVFKKHQLDLTLCKPYGPSYRKLPKVGTYMPCSGRDEMCWEVLNDEWVGHPTWASEDSGFIAHRKNQYEEILFRIEEERHEYDYYMESNLRTIQTLETIANRIANMTAEEKENFKLPNGLGHTSQTIYKKVIRKIYGKDKGFEVIDALHENPVVAVPIVLKRLKQKDEEWRRSHREWNKVWREMEQKVFFKSLDHLGLTFKQADKKLLTSKQLVSEISTIKSEQTNKRLHPLTPKPQKQLDYEFLDDEVLFDICKLVHVFLHSGSSYSQNDKERLYDFFKSFLSLFFSIDAQVIEAELEKRLSASSSAPASSANEINSDKQEIHITSASTPVSDSDGSSSTASTNGRKRHRETDLLKDVLRKTKHYKRDEISEASASPSDDVNSNETADEKQEEEEENQEDSEALSDTWVQTANTGNQSTESINKERSVFNFFANTNIYVFFRHLRVLYDRLLEVKNLNDEVTHDLKTRSDVEFAKDLNLISNQLEDMGLQFAKDDAYSQLLNLSARVIEGEIEHQWFEESLRQAYRNRAYKLYTVDKVTQSLVKHLHSILSDSRSSEIIVLFEKDRKSPVTSAKDQIIYRNSVRSQMNSDENMFRLEYDESKRHVSVQYVAIDDLTLRDHKTDEDKWNYYLTSYVIAHPTEGVNISEVRMPFLKTQELEDTEEGELEGYTDSQLKIKVAKDSYKLFFEAGTHDEFTRVSVFSHPVKEKKQKSVDVLSKVVDEKASSVIDDENDFNDSKEKLKVLLEDPDKYKELLKEKNEKQKEAEADQDQTIEKADETTVQEASTLKQNPAIGSVLEQDKTVDADSTIPQDDTEVKGNDSITEEHGTDTASIITTGQEKASEETSSGAAVDKDGDTNMG